MATLKASFFLRTQGSDISGDIIADQELRGSCAIHVITGPMFSGKSTSLLRRIKSEISVGRSVAMLKSSKDTRYSKDSVVKHDGIGFSCWALPDFRIGKPKVHFDGLSEDYNDKDKDAVLFFDGETFHLEKLHRAVKRLKYFRALGDSAAPFITEAILTKVVPLVPNTVKPDKVVRIDINNSISLEHEKEEEPNRLLCESEEDVNIDDDDDDDQESARRETTLTKEFQTGGLNIDINLPHPDEMEDDEIADVDINDDWSYKGLNAAEALRAQVNAEARAEDPKSPSASSGRESSESGAESSSSGSSSSGKSRNSGT